MITRTDTPATTETPFSRRGLVLLPTLCWGSIIGGTAAAIGIQILLTSLGVGAGLATFTPMTDTNPAAHLSFGAAAVWSVCALIALWFGGVVAGRFSHSIHSGFVHGILVWSLSLIISLLLLSVGTGMVLGGALNVLSEGLGMGGKIATGATEFAKDGMKRSNDQLGSFTDEAVQSIPTNAAPKAITRAKREMGFALTKLFAAGDDVASPDNRAAAIKALVENANMSEANATQAIDDWTSSYRNLKAELDKAKAAAEQKARETADLAASHLSSAAIWSFFALLAGLLLTSIGGSYGARRALLHAESELA